MPVFELGMCTVEQLEASRLLMENIATSNSGGSLSVSPNCHHSRTSPNLRAFARLGSSQQPVTVRKLYLAKLAQRARLLVRASIHSNISLGPEPGSRPTFLISPTSTP